MASALGITSQEVREHVLWGVDLTDGNGVALPDPVQDSFIEEAEGYYGNFLGVVLKENQLVVSDPDPGETYDLMDPAYDYQKDMFLAETWGAIQLRHKPVTKVEKIQLVYPTKDQGTFNVPLTWVRLEPAFGWLRLVPDQLAFFGSFSGALLALFSSGGSLPHSFHIDYRAGFTPAMLAEYPGIREGIRKRAAIKILTAIQGAKGAGVSSESVSVDGHSKSQSYVTSTQGGRYAGEIASIAAEEQEILTHLKQKFSGVRLAVI